MQMPPLHNIKRLSFIIITGCIISCNQQLKTKERKVERAFYYWKSVLKITEFERKVVHHHNVSTLYVRLFDVDWDNNTNQPAPIAQLRINDENDLKKDSLHIIPVIFITNSCIRYIDSLQAEELGIKISKLVNDICLANQVNFSELQIDCDWTALTKNKFFTLLRSVKKRLDQTTKLSATIRLYQIKYRSKTGIPPVDRGLLMAYNMGNLKDPVTNNSIIESKELKKYITELSSYPLPLDIALPLFEWKVLFRNNIFSGLIDNLPDSVLNNQSVKKIAANRFQFIRDTALNGYSFIKGDILRKEESNFEEIVKTEQLLSEKLSTLHIRLSLFHLDSVILKKYSANEMETIFHKFD